MRPLVFALLSRHHVYTTFYVILVPEYDLRYSNCQRNWRDKDEVRTHPSVANATQQEHTIPKVGRKSTLSSNKLRVDKTDNPI